MILSDIIPNNTNTLCCIHNYIISTKYCYTKFKLLDKIIRKRTQQTHTALTLKLNIHQTGILIENKENSDQSDLQPK